MNYPIPKETVIKVLTRLVQTDEEYAKEVIVELLDTQERLEILEDLKIRWGC